jgi:hypothetical protein
MAAYTRPAPLIEMYVAREDIIDKCCANDSALARTLVGGHPTGMLAEKMSP